MIWYDRLHVDFLREYYGKHHGDFQFYAVVGSMVISWKKMLDSGPFFLAIGDTLVFRDPKLTLKAGRSGAGQVRKICRLFTNAVTGPNFYMYVCRQICPS